MIHAFFRLQGTLESVIDVGQGISIGPGRFGKNSKRRALNKRRAWKVWNEIALIIELITNKNQIHLIQK